MSFLLRDKEPHTLYQAFVTTRKIENNLKHGLMKSYFSMNDCQYNGHERHMEHSVDVSVSNKYLNIPVVGYKQIENLNQNVYMRKGSSIANRNTHVHDATVVNNI